jgi:RNA polymerase sigma factor (sigma-70 family)
MSRIGAAEQNLAALRTAIEALPQTSQVVLSLRYVEGLDLVEIEAVTGLPKCRVQRIHDEALASLRVSSGRGA